MPRSQLVHCRTGSLENCAEVSAQVAPRSLPHRQLRKLFETAGQIEQGSLPHRQLRKGAKKYRFEAVKFTAAQAA